jgi:transcriptional regulator with XRE-family HTH domain
MASGPTISGKKLAALRRKALLSQEELAAKSGMSKGGIARIEASDAVGVQARTVRGFAEAMRITADQLLAQIQVAAGSDEEITIRLPRAEFEAIQRQAASHSMSAIEWIIAAAGDQRIVFNRPIRQPARGGSKASHDQKARAKSA